MGFSEWLKKDIEKDIRKIKNNPERFIASLLFAIFGSFCLVVGWYWSNLPAPPSGYVYVTDYHLQGTILLIVGMLFLGVSFLISSTIKVKGQHENQGNR